MSRHIFIFCFLLPSLLFVGCTHTGRTRTGLVGGLATIGAAAGGGALANNLSNGNTAWTAAGAGIGALAAQGAMLYLDEENEAAYANGYWQGMNQASKQQYWIIQRLQEPEAWDQVDPNFRSYVPIVVPEQEINGVKMRENVQFIEVKGG